MHEDITINGWLQRHPEINLGHVRQPSPRPSPQRVRNVILAVLWGVVLLELLYIWGVMR